MNRILTPGEGDDKSRRSRRVARAAGAVSAVVLIAGCVSAMRGREEDHAVSRQQTATFALG